MYRTLLFLLFILWFQAQGQPEVKIPEGYRSRTFTRDDGLSYNHVLVIDQDQTGYLWLATWDGLSRFDGYEFKNYFPVSGDSSTIPYFVVNFIWTDYLNNFWIHCHMRPLVIYDRSKDVFRKFVIPGIRDSLVRGCIPGPDNKSVLFFFPLEQKLIRYNVINQKFSACRVVDQDSIRLFSFWQNSLIQDNTGTLWSPKKTSSGLNFVKGVWLNDSTLTLQNVPPLTEGPDINRSSPDTKEFFTIFKSQSGRTWLFSNYGIFAMNFGSDRFRSFSGAIPRGEFKGIPFCAWISEGKVYIADPEKEKIIQPALPGGTGLFTWYIDRSHNIWYGTVSESRANMGLTRLTETPSWFHHFLTGKDEKGNLNPVFSIVKDSNGNMWAGTRGIGFLFRIKPDGTTEKVSFSHLFPGTEPPRVRSVISDPAGIWIGCTGNYLLYYDLKTEKFRKWKLILKDNQGKERDLKLHNILKYGNDILISGYGIFRFRPSDNTLVQEWFYPSSTNFTFVRVNREDFYAGIDMSRVVRFNQVIRETGRFKTSRDSYLVEHVCPGDSSDIWLALMGGGLGHLYPGTGKSESFTTANGLSNNTAYSILKDKKGNLWISTNQGISMFNPKTRQFRNFGKNEGLQIEEFNSDACYQTPEGEMFFGGVGGFVNFCPDSIYSTNITAKSAPLIITDFRVSGKVRTFEKAVYDLDSLFLQKGDNNFQVTFACINFAYADKISYRYRLSGADTSWIQTDFRNRRINFTNLAPGKYRLDLEASNPEGEWASKTSLFILIPSRFYETGWFKSLSVSLTLAFIMLIVILYVRQIRLKALHKQNELALESIRGQMNPHFIYNSLNSINFFIMRNDRISANKYIADFSRLIRSVLSNMTEEYIPFDQELQSIRDYLKLEYLRFSDKFNYTVEYNFSEEEADMHIMPGMIQPFIENAIWHGIRNLETRTGTVRVTFVLPGEKGFVQCLVEDTGVGRKLSAAYKNDLPGKKSRGISIIEERLKIVNKLRNTGYQIRIEDLSPDQKETGTRVIVDIPLKI